MRLVGVFCIKRTKTSDKYTSTEMLTHTLSPCRLVINKGNVPLSSVAVANFWVQWLSFEKPLDSLCHASPPTSQQPGF